MSREFDDKMFRTAMGAFATGITIVTTMDDDQGAELQGIHGMTANSFTSVSLDPPLVLVSVDKRARMHGLIEQHKVFGVSVLSASQEGVSRHFAGRPDADVEAALTYEWIAGVPVLSEALTAVTCQLWAAYEGGDHTLFVGEVTHVREQEGAPLLYVRGQYGQVAK